MKRIAMGLQVSTLLFLMSLTLLNVEVRWSNADVLLAWSLPILAIIGLFCLVCHRNELYFRDTDLFAIVWMVYWFFRVWIGGEFPCGTNVLKTMQMCFLYAILRSVFCDYNSWFSVLLLCMIVICASAESVWGFNQLLRDSSRHSIYKLTGNFLNPGPYSAYLMIGSIGGICCRRLRWLGIMCLMMLPATWSRAAWLSFVLLSLCLFRNKYWRWRWWVWAIVAIFGVFFYYLKQGSADGRIIIWTASLTSWLNHPWFGIGYGGFCHAFSEGMEEIYIIGQKSLQWFQAAGVTEYAYNALIRVLVEQGVVGVLLCLGMVVTTLVRLLRLYKPLGYCFLSLCFFSCFSYPFEFLPYRIIALLIIITPSKSLSLAQSIRGTNLRSRVAFLSIVMIVTFACSIPVAKAIDRRYQSDNVSSVISLTDYPISSKDYWYLLNDERDNPRFLFHMAQTLQNQERWLDSNALLRIGTEVSSDPMFYVLMGNNYLKLKQPQEAEQAYMKAFAILPNRLYPLFRLMSLYEQTGQPDKAREMAWRVLDFNPKIESPATREMKAKADSLIQKAFMMTE